MKRKLNAEDEPSSVAEETAVETEETEKPEPQTEETKEEVSFAKLGLEERLLQAVAALNFKKPTLVQAKVIPLILDGKDVLAKAKTGSGKTLAYALPLLQNIIKRKQHDTSSFTSGLILVPTLELADQVFRNIEQFAAFCAKDVQTVKLTESDAVQRSLLSASPDIVISTPARAWHHVNNSTLSLDKLSLLVIDEADLIFSYGHDEDLQKLGRALPKGVQTVLTSATLSTEVDALKGVLTRDPVVLDLEETGGDDNDGARVDQLFIKVAEDEKFLFAWIIFHLKLIKGKCIIFVNDVDRCYRLRLFFEQFGIRSCCLNSELPATSRSNVVQEFNKGVYDIIIASDEMDVLGAEGMGADGDEVEDATTGVAKASAGAEKESRRPKKRRKPLSKDYGVSRGIDFQNVACVLNFDLPTTTKSYTHRIGRTGRAGRGGIALSFVVPSDLYRKHVPTSIESAKHDEKVLAKIIKRQAKLGKEVKPWDFDRKQVEAFRYRLNDALRAVTGVAIREARVRELRREILNSSQLKRYLEEHPAELQHLRRHDNELRTTRQQAHLRHIPDYLLPDGAKKALSSSEVGFVPLKKPDKKFRGHKKGGQGKGRGSRFGRKDPLRSGRRKEK